VIDELTAADPGTPVVVGVDDAPLLDDLSALVVHQITQHRAAKVVLTVRDSDPVPVAAQELWREGRFDRLDLQPLSHNETTVLVSAALGGSTDRQSAERLWNLTRGNALSLLNLLSRKWPTSVLFHMTLCGSGSPNLLCHQAWSN
jgi:hypothetical protein